MAQVPETIVQYTGDGTTTQFAFSFPYQDDADVFASVDLVPVSISLSTPGFATITPAPALGTVVLVYRSTPATTTDYIFANGVPFLTRFADTNWRQLLYAIQEVAGELQWQVDRINGINNEQQVAIEGLDSRLDTAETDITALDSAVAALDDRLSNDATDSGLQVSVGQRLLGRETGGGAVEQIAFGSELEIYSGALRFSPSEAWAQLAGIGSGSGNPAHINEAMTYGIAYDTPAIKAQLGIDDLENSRVVSIQPGTNIVVDSTDPLNPVVSATSLIVPGEFNTVSELSALSPDLNQSATTRGCLTVGDGGHGRFIASATAVGPVNGYSCIEAANGLYWNLQPVNGGLNTRQFGGDFALGVLATKGTVFSLKVIGTVTVDGDEIVLDAPITITGNGVRDSKIVFTGSPTKTIRTYRTWKAAYDTGDYSSSDDDAIACGFLITPSASQTSIEDVEIEAYWNPSTDYPLPFNSTTDYPTSEYDYGVLIQAANVSLSRVLVTGPWGVADISGGVAVDITQPNGAPESIRIEDSEIHGRYGLMLLGPHGAGSGPNYSEMVFSDSRGAGGLSDFCCSNTHIFDTQLRLVIDGIGKRVKRYDFGSGGGALWIDGQISRNSAKRQQHVRFKACRFVSVDDYTYYLNFVNRVDFISCHTEFRGGSFLTDGVTANTDAFMFGRTITSNARGVWIAGGDYSGEPDNVTRSSGGVRVVVEDGVDNAIGGTYFGVGRIYGGGQLIDRGVWTPVLRGTVSDGTPVFSAQVGTYTRNKNTVHITGRLVCTDKTGLSGTVTIDGLPFTSSELISATAQDEALHFGVVSNVNFVNMLSGVIDEGTKTILLTRATSGAVTSNITDSHLTVPFIIQFSATYQTDEG